MKNRIFLRSLVGFSLILTTGWFWEKPHFEREIETPEQVVYGRPNTRVAIVRHYSQDSDFAALTIGNHVRYAARFGYDYIGRNGNISGNCFLNPQASEKALALGFHWQKVTAVRDAMAVLDVDGAQKYDWIMWVDADVLFTNMGMTVENFIDVAELKDPSVYFIVGRDSYITGQYINSGVFLVRNTLEGRALMRHWACLYQQYKNIMIWDQAALHDIIFDMHPKGVQRGPSDYEGKDPIPGVVVLPARDFNAIYSGYRVVDTEPGEAGHFWRPGDYLVHFASSKKLDRMREFMIQHLKRRK